ncbi:ArsR family transcriptional regulator [Haloarcula argentinensis DSM 12282]|nr:ArsR family transcriptional regulator [Haloarcula argentinensis DSM 12282]
MTDLTLSPEVADVPPSAKLVYLIVDECGPLSLAEIRARTALPDRTARDAIDVLQEQELIDYRPGKDARSPRYKSSD